MRTHVRSLGWGWSIRVAAGAIGIGLAFSDTPALRAQPARPGTGRRCRTSMPINPVHVALMNNGKVLIVSGSGNVAAETNFRAAVWDPVRRDDHRHAAACRGTCSATAWSSLPDGRVVRQRRQPAVRPVPRPAAERRFDPATGRLHRCRRTWRMAAGIRPSPRSATAAS